MVQIKALNTFGEYSLLHHHQAQCFFLQVYPSRTLSIFYYYALLLVLNVTIMCMGQDGHTGPFLTYPTVGLIVDRWRIGVESCLSHTYGYVTFPTVILKIHMDRWSIPHRDMHGRWSILYTGNIYWQMINPTLGTHIWTGDQFYTGSCMERWSILYWEHI